MSEVSSIPHSNHDDHHHHKETFITKYIFSQDHKMIAKQYLILGVLFMGFSRGEGANAGMCRES